MPPQKRLFIHYSPPDIAGSDADQVAREFEEELEQSSKSIVSEFIPDSTSTNSSLEEDELEYDTENNDDSLQVIEKKTKKRGRPKAMKEPPPPSKDVKFIVRMFSRKEMKKKKSDREAVSASIIMSKEEPFDTFKAQLLQRISEGLGPTNLQFSNYKITYTIKRIKDGVTTLKNENDYKYLLERAKDVANPEVSVFVEEAAKGKKRQQERENIAESDEDDDESEDGEPSKKKGKVQATKAAKFSPEETQRLAHITALRQQWRCNDAKCENRSSLNGGGHCWVNPTNNGKHIYLGHAHLSIWASAMVQGPEVATLMQPPHHALFDSISSGQKAEPSALMRARLANNLKKEEKQQQQQQQQPLMPSFVINIPPYSNHANSMPMSLTSVSASASASASVSAPIDEPLLPSMLSPGPDLPLSEFCAIYLLSDKLKQLLEDEGYDRTSTFEYASISKLEAAGLKSGHIAALKVAIKKWAV